MRQLFNKIDYYFNEITRWIQKYALTIMSFLMIAFYFGYIVYYSVVSFNVYRAIVGCLALFTMIHLNKSL